jgi:hypothetical protein
MNTIHPNIVDKVGKGWDFIIGNLVIFPDNKIMEVTNFEHEVQGNSNLFTYDNKKNVYSITLRSYVANRDDYSDASDITDSQSYDYEDFGNLDKIFNTDEEKYKDVTKRSQDQVLEDEVIYPQEIRNKPLRDKTKEAPQFGDFG